IAWRKVADADDERAHQLLGGVIRDLRARPFRAELAEIDAHLPRRISCLRKRLHLDDPSDAQVQAGEVVVAGVGGGSIAGHCRRPNSVVMAGLVPAISTRDALPI